MRFVTNNVRLACTTLALALAVRAAAAPDALAFFQAKRYLEAQAAFERLASAEPHNAVNHFYLGVLALRRNDTHVAIAELEQAVALDPTQSDYFANLGSAYGDAAQSANLFSKASLARKCRDALEKAVELNPGNLDARDGLVTYYRKAPSFVGGGLDKAYAEAEEIRKRDLVRGTLVLSAIYTSEKKFTEAFAAVDTARKSLPHSYLTLYAFGRVAAESGQRLDEGTAALRECLTLAPPPSAPPHASVHWRLGVIAEKRGDAPAARSEYEAALKLDPDFRLAKDSLAKLP